MALAGQVFGTLAGRSAMLIGAGVQGDQVIGGFDDAMLGQRIDLKSGGLTDSGTLMTSGHLGATLLALADIDPGSVLDGAEPIAGALA